MVEMVEMVEVVEMVEMLRDRKFIAISKPVKFTRREIKIININRRLTSPLKK
ncbi:hypothetical protein NIES4072_00220 [Nostoc commune NIES-4072]|uniref:Uncharacterized protein n=1 Tax=Nostoc commune NIES-4072 TaxID=2005467 RepID=A0A2R5FDJ2_NOSCO|nr:hypothetical protein NIES4070_26590 [Nostoc commune HK-02]GBG16376.1 hypothetical protein NIES4072_00220 [Nostoc commune NIES-4072]